MSIYNVNYSILIKYALPPDKRKPIMESWLNACFDTVKTNHTDIFTTFRNDVIAKTKHNGQKIIMESILNETFGVVSPPFIYIDNTGDDKRPETFYNKFEGYPPVFLWNQSEAQPPLFFYNQTETAQNKDFKVYVPSAVYSTYGEPKIASEVDRLRPYSTQYQIISY